MNPNSDKQNATVIPLKGDLSLFSFNVESMPFTVAENKTELHVVCKQYKP